ncbi:Protein of unknown function [Pyronema omphalodes CBS 100304]|uniref:Uncharacterized protein n=1 Tax=Pyronema omphalodes (strain CBS 100304) TaxID=1076935 RepID=U4L4R5_PYROM|nr:Protein of unknown function [Pyronema omphalodes CBS 100304]
MLTSTRYFTKRNQEKAKKSTSWTHLQETPNKNNTFLNKVKTRQPRWYFVIVTPSKFYQTNHKQNTPEKQKTLQKSTHKRLELQSN